MPVINRIFLSISLIVLIFSTLPVLGQSANDYRSKGNGNWSDISSWERYDGAAWVAATATPDASSGVISIKNGNQITITALVDADQIVVEPGSTLINESILTLTNSGIGNIELELFGIFIARTGSSISRTSSSYSPLIYVKNGGIYEHARSFANGIFNAESVSTVVWEDGSTCIITSDPGSFNASLKQDFYNLTFNWTTGSTEDDMEGDRPDAVRGTFKVVATGASGRVVLSDASVSRTMIVNNFELNGGTFVIGNASADAVLTINGNCSVSGGELYVAGSGSSGTKTLSIAGNFSQTGGDFQVCRTNTAGTYNATIDGSATFSGGTAFIKNNSSSGSVFAALTVKGNTTINGGNLNLNGDGNGTNQGRFFVRGNLTLSSGVLRHSRANTTGGSGIYFDGSAVTQTFTWSGGTLDTSSGGVGKRFYYKISGGPSALNETYNASAAQGTINGLQGSPASGYAAWPVTGTLIKNLVINNSAGVRMTTRKTVNTQLTLQNGFFKLDSALRIADGGTIQRVQGTLSNAPLFTNNVNVVYGDGGTSGSITPGLEMPLAVSNILNNLTIDNPNGVTMIADIAVKGTLTLTSGTITIPVNTILFISSGNAVAGTNFGVNKHIITLSNTSTGALGLLRTGSISSSRFYPIGNGTYYLPATLVPSAASDFNLNVFTGATEDGTVEGTPFSTKTDLVDAIWTFNRTAGGLTPVDITLHWDGALEGSNFATSADGAIGVSRHDGNSWDGLSGTGASNTLNIVTRTGVTEFSPFIVWISNPLPVKFGKLSATRKNKDVQLNWTSYEESSLSHYEIQRSNDGKNFIATGNVNASGNGLLKFDYNWYDFSAPQSAVFYRIKSVDEDGKTSYSNVVRVSGLGRNTSGLLIYPNPVNKGGQINIQLPELNAGKYRIVLTDISGRQLYQEMMNFPGGISNFSIGSIAQFGKGIYNLSIDGNGFRETKSFIITE